MGSVAPLSDENVIQKIMCGLENFLWCGAKYCSIQKKTFMGVQKIEWQIRGNLQSSGQRRNKTKLTSKVRNITAAGPAAVCWGGGARNRGHGGTGPWALVNTCC